MEKRIVYVVCRNDREKRMVSLVDAQGIVYTQDIYTAICMDSEHGAIYFIEFLMSILPDDYPQDYFVIKAVKL